MQLEEFLTAAEAIVGANNVSRDPTTGAPEGLDGSRSYGDPFPLSRPHKPGPAIRPETVDQVRDLVHCANKLKVPMWTVSRGKNLGYGGSAPVLDDSIILDLHRMNKIIEINEEYAYAIVEPGVTFIDLYEEIKRRKLNLWLSVPAIGWGSVVGNTLERGIGYTPEAAHYKYQCGMEVVLPDGDLLRTGMGVVEDSKVWPLYSGGFGPGLDGIFFQSNYGIVTKIGIHMSPAPEAYTRIIVEVPEEPDFAPLVGAMTDLMRRRIVANPPQLFDRMTLIIGAARMDPEVAKALGEYAWRAGFALYGPPEAQAGLLNTVKRRFEQVKGAKLTSETFNAAPGEYLRSENITPDFLPQNGVPGIDHALAFSSKEDGLWHNCYSPVLPPSGRELYEWYVRAKKITADHDLNFVADFHVFDRYVISINLIMFHPPAKARLYDVQYALMDDSKKLGYLEYRTHISFMEATAVNQTFNNNAFGRFTTMLKDTIDPNGILSPGKQGIWNSTAKSERLGLGEK
ncbi:putative vanillyl-alcohol oxidase [Triangularia verruculosa]|uniref:Vanillyl-alcohol oxidase n=1 Tax=Triangularia verruculosa TaxID=2587418 RepID=A0AAN6XS08_9PEZI|nr:putative vanillyl-alcohol oxidase [Triangularia verruculosa]